MPAPRNRFLEKMLQRLYASLAAGPALDCRPHRSRQRVDLAALAALGAPAPELIVRELLAGSRAVKIVPRLQPATEGDEDPDAEKRALLRRLRNIAEDARAFEQDTGARALHVGFPLLHLPPGQRASATRSGATKRILAPIAFVPVTLTVKVGRSPQVVLEVAAGADPVVPNTALLAW